MGVHATVCTQLSHAQPSHIQQSECLLSDGTRGHNYYCRLRSSVIPLWRRGLYIYKRCLFQVFCCSLWWMGLYVYERCRCSVVHCGESSGISRKSQGFKCLFTDEGVLSSIFGEYSYNLFQVFCCSFVMNLLVLLISEHKRFHNAMGSVYPFSSCFAHVIECMCK